MTFYKQSILTALLCCVCGLLTTGCNDQANLIGSTIQPDDDRITIYSDTFQMELSTIKKDTIYARTSSGLLGEFYDPQYGRLKADFITQFYCQDGFKFAHTPNGNKIDSVVLRFDCDQFSGDPGSTMQAKVYAVTQPLERDFYTNMDPKKYCDMQTLLGSAIYTPANFTRIKTPLSNRDTAAIISYAYTMRLDTELGQRIYDTSVSNPAAFANQEAFNRYFPGIYVTVGYGSGNIVSVQKSSLWIYYNTTIKNSKGADSTVLRSEVFASSKDVIQLNRMQSFNDETLLVDNEKYTYLKTPAGILTRIVIPATQIASVTKGRMLNEWAFSIAFQPQAKQDYPLAPPPQLLLMPEDSLAGYFRFNPIENGQTTFLSTSGNASSLTQEGFSAINRTYYFKNLAPLLRYHIQNHPNEDLRLLLVPVKRDSYSSASDNGTFYYTTRLSNYLLPSGVTLRKDADHRRVIVKSSRYTR